MAHIHNDVDIHDVQLVVEVHDAEADTIVLWHSSLTEDGRFVAGDNVVADAIIFGEDLSPKGKTIKTYLWNVGKGSLTMNKISYYVTRKSRVLTGLYDPLN